MKHPQGNHSNVFARTGEGWIVSYAGVLGVHGDSIGLHYISHLLNEPGAEKHVSDLVLLVRGMPVEVTSSDCIYDDAGVSLSGMSRQEILSPGARRRIKAHLEELEGELEARRCAGDTARLADLGDEVVQLRAQLKHAGHGAHAKTFIAPSDRDRKSVGNAIARAIKQLASPNVPLARHLRNSIQTGYTCIYWPEQPTEWQLGCYGACSNATQFVAHPL